MILQDRDLDKRDLRIRQEDEPLVAAGEPYASLDCTELQGVEPLAAESHNLEAYMRVVVVTAELSNSFSEGPAEERHVQHRHDANKRRPEFSVSYDLEGIGGRRLVETADARMVASLDTRPRTCARSRSLRTLRW